MRARDGWLSFASLVVWLAACGGDDFAAEDTSSGNGGGGGSGPGPTCGDVCATRAELKCAGETEAKCESDCTYLAALFPWCDGQAAGALDCLGHEPKESFACEDTGTALRVKPNVCSADIAALTECFYEGPAEGLPDLTSDCQELCNATQNLPCAPADCMSACAKGIADAEPCNGAAAGYVHCAAGEPAESWECDAQVPPKPKLKGLTCSEYVYLLIVCPS